MATTDLERLVVQMSLDIRQFERQLAKANGTTARELSKVERRFQATQRRIQGSIATFGKGLIGPLAGLGAFAAGSAITRFLTDTINKLDDLGDTADKIGITAEQLQVLGFAAQQSGSNLDEMSQALVRFQKSVGDASQGQGELLKLFQDNGVALRDVNGNLRPIIDLFLDYADLIKNAETQTDKLNVGFAGMGKGAAALVVALSGGAEGIRQFEKELRETGIVSDDNVKKAQGLADEWKKAMAGMTANAQTFVLQTISEFQKIQTLLETISAFAANIFLQAEAAASQDPRVRAAIKRAGGTPQSGVTLTSVDDRESRLTRDRTINQAIQQKTIIRTKEEEEALRKAAQAADEHARAIERGAAAYGSAIENAELRNAELRKEIEIVGLSKGAQEAARLEMELMNDALSNHVVVTTEVQEHIRRVAEEYGRLTEQLAAAQESIELIGDVNQAVRDSFQGFFDDLRSGTDVVDALQNALSNLLDKVTDLALNAALDALFKTGSGATTGGLLGTLFHQGGVVGQGGFKRSVSPLAFIGAPRMHNGGIAGNEVPAILRKGEVVLPGLPSSGGAANVEINIVNESKAEIQQTQRTGPDGQRVFELKVLDVMGKNLPKMMSSQFGIGPRLSQRG